MFHKILVPLDGSQLAEGVLPHVVALARALDARVILLRILEQEGDADHDRPVDPVHWASTKAEAQKYLSVWINRLQEIGLSVEAALRTGAVADQIIDAAHSFDIDLVALSSHGYSGLNNWTLSSVTQKVLRRSQRSILLIRAHGPVAVDLTALRYRRVLLPLDGSQRAEHGYLLAQRIAQHFDSVLLLTHVVVQPETHWHGRSDAGDLNLAQQMVERNRAAGATYLADIQSRSAVKSEICVLSGTSGIDAMHHLVDWKSIDLTVMTAHGHSGSPYHLFGSVATTFIDHGLTPLLLVQDLDLGQVIPTQAELGQGEESRWAV